jgi:phospholipase C
MNTMALPWRRVAALFAAGGFAVPAVVVLPWSGGTGRAAAAGPPVQHVVVLDLENHSFDNVLGFWCNDHPGRCPDGGMPGSVKLSNGAVVDPGPDPDVVPDVQHRVSDQVSAIDRGMMDGWDRIPGCSARSGYACVSGYQPAQEPNLAALASKFAVSDKFFSLADSPSFGGHLDIVTGNMDGFTGNRPRDVHGVKPGQGWGCDSDKAAPWSAGPGQPVQRVPGCIPDPALENVPNGGAFEPTPAGYEPTIMDELTTAGKSWRLYTGGCTEMATGHNGLLVCRKADRGYDWAICPAIAQCLYTQAAAHTSTTGQVLSAAVGGRLPAFSVVTPAGSYAPDSEHNGFSMTAGDDFVGQVAHAIMTGPEWNSTVLFITWDDCGCFYDQVRPPVNPDGSREGPRVPLVIVSPYARPAYTDTSSASFASVLAYVEHTYGLPALGVNDAHAYDLSSAFNYSQAPLKPIPMVIHPVPRGDRIDWSQASEDS